MVELINLNYRPSKKDIICEYIGSNYNVLQSIHNNLKVFNIGKGSFRVAFTSEKFAFNDLSKLIFNEGPTLNDIQLPIHFLNTRNSIRKIRKKLGIKKRPIIATTIDSKHYEDYCKEASDIWKSGVDVIFDDDNHENHKSFVERIFHIQNVKQAIEKSMGEKKTFIPDLSNNFEKRHELLKNIDSKIFSLNPDRISLSEISSIRKKTKMIMVANKPLFRKKAISNLALEKLICYLGFDMARIDIKNRTTRIMPILSNSIHPTSLWKTKMDHGHDFCAYSINSIWNHPDGHKAGAKAMRLGADHANIHEHIHNHSELSKAFHKWG